METSAITAPMYVHDTSRGVNHILVLNCPCNPRVLVGLHEALYSSRSFVVEHNA